MAILLNEKVSEFPSERSERWLATFSSANGFRVVESTRRYGTTANGKSWSSFQEKNTTFYSLKSGKLRIFRRDRVTPQGQNRTRMGQLRDETGLSVARRTRVHDSIKPFYDAGAAYLGYKDHEELIKAEFPLAPFFWVDAPGMPNLVRLPDFTAVARQLLGRNYQRSVTRALAEPTPGAREREIRTNQALVTSIFQGIAPTDWIPPVLHTIRESRMEFIVARDREAIRSARRLLRSGTRDQLRRIVGDLSGSSAFLTLMDVAEIGPPPLRELDFRNIEELHTTAIDEAISRRLSGPAEPISYSGRAKRFAGKASEYAFIAPESTDDLWSWGRTMRNCIGSYGRKAAKGACLLYAVTRNGEMVANIELDPQSGSVIQLLGKHNQPVSSAISKTIKMHILRYWPQADVDGGWQ